MESNSTEACIVELEQDYNRFRQQLDNLKAITKNNPHIEGLATDYDTIKQQIDNLKEAMESDRIENHIMELESSLQQLMEPSISIESNSIGDRIVELEKRFQRLKEPSVDENPSYSLDENINILLNPFYSIINQQFVEYANDFDTLKKGLKIQIQQNHVTVHTVKLQLEDIKNNYEKNQNINQCLDRLSALCGVDIVSTSIQSSRNNTNCHLILRNRFEMFSTEFTTSSKSAVMSASSHKYGH